MAEFNCPEHVFPKHSHDEFVLGANIMGRETITLDRQTLEATTDQVTLYNPAQVQSSKAISAEWSFVSIYLRPSEFAGLAELDENIIFEQPVTSTTNLSKSVVGFVRRALSPSAREGLLEMELGNLLIDLLSVSGSSHAKLVSPSDLEMQAVAELLMDQMAEPPRLSDVALQFGIGPVTLVRSFKRAFGLPPLEWLNLNRINIARTQLRFGRPLADVAFELGYADQAHFSRRFKAATGITPSMFKQVK